MRGVPILVLVLAACAPETPPSTQEQACAQRIYDDPAVRDFSMKSTQAEWLWQNAGKLDIVKQQALARCLQARGGRIRGGVERPR